MCMKYICKTELNLKKPKITTDKPYNQIGKIQNKNIKRKTLP